MGSKVLDEVISTIFGQGDNGGCKTKREDCASLIQNCVSEPSGELLRPSLEGAKQKFYERSLPVGVDCESGDGGGGHNNHERGLRVRRNSSEDEDEDRKDSSGGRNRDRNRDKGKNNDRKAPPLAPSNQPEPAATQSSATLPPPPPQSTSSATIQTSGPTLASFDITSVIAIAQSIISLQTTITTAPKNSSRKEENNYRGNKNSIIDVYRRNWSLFCTDKTESAIREAEKVLLKRCCYECDPEEIKKDQCDRCMRKEVLEKWERDPVDLLRVMEGAANGTMEREGDGEKERGLKFPQKTLTSGALGNGGLGRIDMLLGVILGIGSVVWGI